MARCENKVDQTVPTRYSAKIVQVSCGSTGIYGEAVMCDECEAKISAGSMLRPGYCKHGNRLYDDSDRDIVCGACEFD